jgi:hypothetical protein
MTTAEAIKKHGAKAVSDAAYRAMNGDRAALDRVGLSDVKGLSALNTVTVECFAQMSDREKAQDLAEAAINAAKIK